MTKLNDNEYGAFFKTYINAIPQNSGTAIDNLEDSFERAKELFDQIPENKYQFKYAEGKWTIKELLQHLIDSERVFAYRALRFARKDSTDLPGFDENIYVDNSNANERPFKEILDEFVLVRKSTISMFKGFTNEAMLQMGTANNNELSVRALSYITSGHLLHHLNIIRERYL